MDRNRFIKSVSSLGRDRLDVLNLYGQEYYIFEKLFLVFNTIPSEQSENYNPKDTYRRWSLDFNEVGKVLGKENGDNYETACFLMVLRQLDVIERGTSIRYSWTMYQGSILIEGLLELGIKFCDYLSDILFYLDEGLYVTDTHLDVKLRIETGEVKEVNDRRR